MSILIQKVVQWRSEVEISQTVLQLEHTLLFHAGQLDTGIKNARLHHRLESIDNVDRDHLMIELHTFPGEIGHLDGVFDFFKTMETIANLLAQTGPTAMNLSCTMSGLAIRREVALQSDTYRIPQMGRMPGHSDPRVQALERDTPG